MKKASEQLREFNKSLNEIFEEEMKTLSEEDANALRAMFRVEDEKIDEAIKEIERMEKEEEVILHDFNTFKKSITAIFN